MLPRAREVRHSCRPKVGIASQLISACKMRLSRFHVALGRAVGRLATWHGKAVRLTSPAPHESVSRLLEGNSTGAAHAAAQT